MNNKTKRWLKVVGIGATFSAIVYPFIKLLYLQYKDTKDEEIILKNYTEDLIRKKNHRIFKLFEPLGDPNLDVIFIHGIDGNAYQTWESSDVSFPLEKNEFKHCSKHLQKMGIATSIANSKLNPRIFSIQHPFKVINLNAKMNMDDVIYEMI